MSVEVSAHPLYASQVFCGDEMERVQILGKVIACTFAITNLGGE